MSEVLYTALLQGSLRLSKTGEWFHNGTPFENQRVIDLFNRSVCWDDQRKTYVVRIGQGQALFSFDDTPYFVAELLDDASPWHVLLTDGSREELRPDTLRVGAEGQIYCEIKDGHRARFSRAAHQRLMIYVQDERTILIDGKEVKPPSV